MLNLRIFSVHRKLKWLSRHVICLLLSLPKWWSFDFARIFGNVFFTSKNGCGFGQPNIILWFGENDLILWRNIKTWPFLPEEGSLYLFSGDVIHKVPLLVLFCFLKCMKKLACLLACLQAVLLIIWSWDNINSLVKIHRKKSFLS